MSAGSDASTSRSAAVTSVGQGAGVGVRLLDDGQSDHAGPAVDAGVAALELRALGDPGDLFRAARRGSRVAFTGICLRSSSTCSGRGPSRPITRIGFSIPPASAKPPLVLTLLSWRAGLDLLKRHAVLEQRGRDRRAPGTASGRRPSVITWATPGILSSRGRTTQSASVRRARSRFDFDGSEWWRRGPRRSPHDLRRRRRHGVPAPRSRTAPASHSSGRGGLVGLPDATAIRRCRRSANALGQERRSRHRGQVAAGWARLAAQAGDHDLAHDRADRAPSAAARPAAGRRRPSRAAPARSGGRPRISLSQPNSTLTIDSPPADWRPHVLHAVGAEHGRFDRIGDERLDLLGGQPGHSVMMVTRGRSRSGNTSIGIVAARYAP